MAQELQIVPKYLHSHVETYINDNTQFEDAVSTPIDTNAQFVAMFRSSMGQDNVLIKKNDLSDFYKTYGKSNYQKFGQPLMMPIAMLNSGNSTVYCMRVMPDDAYAANGILTMLYKFDDVSGKMIIKYKASYVDKSTFADPSAYKSNAVFKKTLHDYAEVLRVDEPDADGFREMPIATFRMSGRGVYGNDYRWRIARNMDYEKDYQIKMFSFEALSAKDGLKKVQTYVGSIVTSDKYKNTTLINDVLDAAETGSAIMDVQVFEDFIFELYDMFVEFVSGLDESMQDPIPDADCWDIFFNHNVMTNQENINMEIIPEGTGDDYISVDRPSGVTLAGGDDGLFASDDPATVKEAETQCYIDAFSGVYDRSILSSRRVPCAALLDANYPFEVKQVMAQLINTRESGILYLDAGTNTTLAQIDNIIDEYSIFNTRNIVKEFQHYSIKDPETKKKCEVSITYFYAQQLPVHYQQNGSWVPFVKARAQLYGHVKNSLQPCIDDIDMDIKEKLYNARINYFECIEENVYQRCSQNTAQNINSDLLEENNMNTLFEAKKIIERDCWNALYDFTSADDRARFSKSEQAKFESWEGSRLATISIDFDVTEWEAERSIVHCYVAIQFRNLMKRVIIEIDVNKRDFLA